MKNSIYIVVKVDTRGKLLSIARKLTGYGVAVLGLHHDDRDVVGTLSEPDALNWIIGLNGVVALTATQHFLVTLR